MYEDILKPKRFYPKNPLGIISLFVFFIELISTVSLKYLLEHQSFYIGHIIWFIILYPSIITIVFFLILLFKRESLYSPTDFRNDESFINLVKKVKKIEIRQEASVIDTESDIDNFIEIIDKLISVGDFYSSIQVGRSLLKESKYQNSYKVFSYLNDKIPKKDRLYSRNLANLAYSLIGLKKYEDAINILLKVYSIRKEKHFYSWHACALAYSYYMINEKNEYKKWIDYAKNRDEYLDYKDKMSLLYPEIKNDL